MKKTIRWIALALSLLLTAGSVAAVPGNAATSGEIREELELLEEQEQQIAEKLEELEKLHGENLGEMEQLLAEKDITEQQIALLYAQIENSNQQIRACGLLIADKQDALDQAEEAFELLSVQHRERIIAMEENGQLSYWSILFEANSFGDFLDRITMVQEIAASDQARLTQLQQAKESVEQAAAQLQEQKAVLQQDRNTLEQSRLALQDKQNQLDGLLRQLAAKDREYTRYLEESEALQHELMEQIAKKESELEKAEYEEWLAQQKPADPDPSTPPVSSGGWITPVTNYYLSSPFGMRLHPIDKVMRMHNGVDMACPTGTPIYAARSGMVTVAAYQKNGAGNYVSINHGDGFASIYMHMTHYIVSPGQYVQAGQVIGYVGSTGASKGPHLHFGISYKGTYVNPMEYLG